MSRIRTIKPEFWTSEQVISCSPLSRLLFIGLWNFCDDNGVHPASYIRLKAEIFPADPYSSDEIKRWVGELITNDLVREYAIEDKIYWVVTGWKNHQRIDRPTYRHPFPHSELKKIGTDSSSPRSEIDNNLSTISRLADDPSTTEWKGMEGNGEEKEIREVKTSPHVFSDPNRSSSHEIQEVFKYWQDVLNHPRAKLDNKRHRKITQALKLGYSVADLKQAIDGCAKTPFNMGENNSNQRYDDLDLIIRDSAHIDRFVSNAINPPSTSIKANNITTDVMAGAI
ncbi:MAG TPA: hypothetical protein VLJ15_08200 [Gammaproteobacteria bacterium]|nr:hypothetical protein [Gammaproteobacteria bacterium]